MTHHTSVNEGESAAFESIPWEFGNSVDFKFTRMRGRISWAVIPQILGYGKEGS